jgi:putative oxidoreductase
MIFPQLAPFTDLALLLLRVMVGIVFITSGWNHLKKPAARSRDIGMSKGFTIFLGAIEVAGGLGVMLGVVTQLAALGLILVMLGAISEKDFHLAHRLLGRIRNKRMELRHDAGGNESRDRHHRR